MDGGSSLNLIYQDTVRKMGIDPSRIKPSNTTYRRVNFSPFRVPIEILNLLGKTGMWYFWSPADDCLDIFYFRKTSQIKQFRCFILAKSFLKELKTFQYFRMYWQIYLMYDVDMFKWNTLWTGMSCDFGLICGMIERAHTTARLRFC